MNPFLQKTPGPSSLSKQNTPSTAQKTPKPKKEPKVKVPKPPKDPNKPPKIPKPRKPRNPNDKPKKREVVIMPTKIKITTAPGKDKKKERLEELTEAPIEEQIILRLPPSPATQEFRNLVKKRKIPEGFSLAFTENRNATIKLGMENTPPMNAKLVDLPCILESLKTIDNKQFYKISDICQMLIVNDPKYPHPPTTSMTDKTSYPDGITPPLKSVRIRRFRKRMSKKVIEDVEREVERLLQADLDAEDVKFEVTEQRDIDFEGTEDFLSDQEDDDVDDAQQEQEDDILAAEIEEALYADNVQAEDSESAESSEDEDEEDDDEEIDAENQQIKEHMSLLKEEISDIERKITEKKSQSLSIVNPIIKKRFEDVIQRLTTELELKREQLQMTNFETAAT